MKLPKLYRKVYLIAHEQFDDEHPLTIYVQANLALDEENNMFWQVANNSFNNDLYDYSDLDRYDLSVPWSANEDPAVTFHKNYVRHNPDYSCNRATVQQAIDLDEIPF